MLAHVTDDEARRKILARRAAFVAAVSVVAACEPAESPPPMVCLSQSIDYPDATTEAVGVEASTDSGAERADASEAGASMADASTPDASASDAGKRDAGPNKTDAGARPHPCLSPRPTVCLSMMDIE